MNNKDKKCLYPIIFSMEQKGKIISKQLCADKSDLWPDLSKVLTKNNSRLPILFIPPELNLELIFYYTCKKTGVPASIGKIYNIMSTIDSIKILKHDTLITTPELAEILLKTLKTKNKNSVNQFKTIFLVDTKNSHKNYEQIKAHAQNSSVVYSTHPILKT